MVFIPAFSSCRAKSPMHQPLTQWELIPALRLPQGHDSHIDISLPNWWFITSRTIPGVFSKDRPSESLTTLTMSPSLWLTTYAHHACEMSTMMEQKIKPPIKWQWHLIDGETIPSLLQEECLASASKQKQQFLSTFGRNPRLSLSSKTAGQPLKYLTDPCSVILVSESLYSQQQQKLLFSGSW